MVEHSPQYLKVKGLSLASAAGTKREKIVDNMTLTNSSSTVVKYSAHHLKVEGLSPANVAGTKREKMVKEYMKGPWSLGVAQW